MLPHHSLMIILKKIYLLDNNKRLIININNYDYNNKSIKNIIFSFYCVRNWTPLHYKTPFVEFGRVIHFF